jgi:hypothetical protein
MDEIFSHVAKLTYTIILMCLAASFDIAIDEMDVKITFLHGDLEEEICIKQCEGFAVKGKKEMVIDVSSCII